MKFWLGPQVGAHYIFGTSRFNVYNGNYSAMLLASVTNPIILYSYNRTKYNLAGLDLGLAMGRSIDVKKCVTISISGGIKYGGIVGGVAFRSGSLFKNNSLVYGHGFDRFLDVAVLYQYDGSQS